MATQVSSTSAMRPDLESSCCGISLTHCGFLSSSLPRSMALAPMTVMSTTDDRVVDQVEAGSWFAAVT